MNTQEMREEFEKHVMHHFLDFNKVLASIGYGVSYTNPTTSNLWLEWQYSWNAAMSVQEKNVPELWVEKSEQHQNQLNLLERISSLEDQVKRVTKKHMVMCAIAQLAQVDLLKYDSSYPRFDDSGIITQEVARELQQRTAELKDQVVDLKDALQSAVKLRVALYRNSDQEGKTDSWSDEKVAMQDTYASKWVKTILTIKEEDLSARSHHDSKQAAKVIEGNQQ